MNTQPNRFVCTPWVIAAVLTGAWLTLFAEDTPSGPASPPATKVEWSAKDTTGKDVKVPVSGRPTVLVFALADQSQSQQATTQAKAVIEAEATRTPPAAQSLPAQVVLVLTGAGAEATAGKLAKSGAWAWPIVIDKDYAVSGRTSVRVWPTTVVVSATGEPLGHLAGFPPSYAKQLEICLSFASGRIDKAEMERQQAARQVVADSAAQMAGRHLQVADRLIAQGLVEQAHDELAKGLQLQPGDSALQLAMVRVLVLMGQPEGALAALEKLDVAAVPAWQVALWRGRVLMALGKWDQARVILSGATRMNPQPAEAYYAIGLVHQHQGEWQQAAEAFRLAFESTPTGRSAVGGSPNRDSPPVKVPDTQVTKPGD